MLEQVEKNPGIPIYTYGPLIHNEEVVKELEKLGKSLPAKVLLAVRSLMVLYW